MKNKTIACLLPLIAIAAAEPPKTDPAKLSEMTKVLASDEFGGRSPGTEGCLLYTSPSPRD